MPDTPSDLSRQQVLDEYIETVRLAGSLAHEIRSPLSTIRLTMEVMAEDLQNPQTSQERRNLEMINTVVRQCLRLETMLTQFMKYAKASEVEPVPADLNTEVRAVLTFYREKAKQLGIELMTYQRRICRA